MEKLPPRRLIRTGARATKYFGRNTFWQGIDCAVRYRSMTANGRVIFHLRIADLAGNLGVTVSKVSIQAISSRERNRSEYMSLFTAQCHRIRQNECWVWTFTRGHSMAFTLRSNPFTCPPRTLEAFKCCGTETLTSMDSVLFKHTQVHASQLSRHPCATRIPLNTPKRRATAIHF